LPDNLRACCCKDKNKVNCRLSETISRTHHIVLDDVSLLMGQVPSGGKGFCAPHWFPSGERGGWWPKGNGCGWMNQIHKCGPPYSAP
jgi:hypothetical protein